jgi:hypothetical protein
MLRCKMEVDVCIDLMLMYLLPRARVSCNIRMCWFGLYRSQQLQQVAQSEGWFAGTPVSRISPSRSNMMWVLSAMIVYLGLSQK